LDERIENTWNSRPHRSANKEAKHSSSLKQEPKRLSFG